MRHAAIIRASSHIVLGGIDTDAVVIFAFHSLVLIGGADTGHALDDHVHSILLLIGANDHRAVADMQLLHTYNNKRREVFFCKEKIFIFSNPPLIYAAA